MIDLIVSSSIPALILFIVFFSFKEKQETFNNFISGANSGLNTLLNIVPMLLGLFVAINMLRVSGVMNGIMNLLSPIFLLFDVPKEIIPIAVLRPISGSATIAVATELLKEYGTDSEIGLMISTIIGSTETTIYTIAIYTSGKKYKNTWQVLVVALIGDFIGVIASIRLWGILS